MKLALYSLYLGGVLNIAWAIFHLGFSRIFKWDRALASVDYVNRTVYRIINLCLTYCFLAAGVITLVYGPQMLQPGLGLVLTAVLGGFWLFRFLLQIWLFKLTHPISLLLSFFFLLTLAAYAYPWCSALRG